jgi:hypothetical protein
MPLSRIAFFFAVFGLFADANDSLSLMQKQAVMLSDDGSDEDGDISSSTEDLEWQRITCPVMGALFRAGDLIPNADGVVTKAQTRAAMLRAGISEEKTIGTTNGNFDHLPGDKEINLFNMDLQMSFDKPLKLRNKEHDFSTGVRDGAKPNNKAYNVFEQFIGTDGDSSSWSQTDIGAAIKYYKEHSNDLGSGMGGIFSLSVMLAEFADDDGTLSKVEMKRLFLRSQYPAQFKQRRDVAVTAWEASARR